MSPFASGGAAGGPAEPELRGAQGRLHRCDRAAAKPSACKDVPWRHIIT